MNNLKLHLIFQFAIIYIGAQLNPYHNIFMAVVQDEILIQPCQVLPDSQAQLFYFSKLFSDRTSLTQFAISGWFLFQGQYNQVYCLFSVYRNGVLVVSLFYDSSNAIYLNVQGQITVQNNPLVNHQVWINIILEFNTNNLCQVMISTPSGNFMFSQTVSSMSPPILINELIFNGGNPPQILGLNPSCSLIKRLVLCIDCQFNILSQSKIEDYLNHIKTSLLQHYDYYYTLKNNNYLIGDFSNLHQKFFLILIIIKKIMFCYLDNIFILIIQFYKVNKIILFRFMQRYQHLRLFLNLYQIFIAMALQNMFNLKTTASCQILIFYQSLVLHNGTKQLLYLINLAKLKYL
ncbi:hypothetical protein ABPG72_012946 [Tetrahymena utriculariae]